MSMEEKRLIEVFFDEVENFLENTSDSNISVCYSKDLWAELLNDYEALKQELSKFKDLEKQINCPLKALVRALQNGIWKTMWFDYEKPVLRHYSVRADNDCLIFDYLRHDTEGQDEVGEVYLKDYKKTWWLRKDKSE